MVKKQVTIDEETHRLLKIYAADKQTTMCDAIREWITDERKK